MIPLLMIPLLMIPLLMIPLLMILLLMIPLLMIPLLMIPFLMIPFLRIRERCQLAHAMLAGHDFTLGRFVPKGSATLTCKYHGWRPYWRPPTNGICNSSAIDGYLTM